MSGPFADIFLDCRAETHLGNRQTEGESSILEANRRRNNAPNPLKISKVDDSAKNFLAILLLG